MVVHLGREGGSDTRDSLNRQHMYREEDGRVAADAYETRNDITRLEYVQ